MWQDRGLDAPIDVFCRRGTWLSKANNNPFLVDDLRADTDSDKTKCIFWTP
jgi:hypothetical protein